jgi:AcrR family transcriptional regulator
VARRLFYTNGYGATSLGDLARESEIPKGNFYYHFRSKDDVLSAVVEARHQDVETQLEQWRSALHSPRKRLHRVVDMLVREEENLTRYGCPMGSLLTELGKAQPQLQEKAFAVLGAIIDFAEREFAAAGRSNDARDQAIHLIGRCQGAVVMAHGLNSRGVLQREIGQIREWLDGTLLAPGPETATEKDEKRRKKKASQKRTGAPLLRTKKALQQKRER